MRRIYFLCDLMQINASKRRVFDVRTDTEGACVVVGASLEWRTELSGLAPRVNGASVDTDGRRPFLPSTRWRVSCYREVCRGLFSPRTAQADRVNDQTHRSLLSNEEALDERAKPRRLEAARCLARRIFGPISVPFRTRNKVC